MVEVVVEYIFGLDVSVNDVLAVDGLEALANLKEDPYGLNFLEFGLLVDVVGEGEGVLAEFKTEVVVALEMEPIVELDDVGTLFFVDPEFGEGDDFLFDLDDLLGVEGSDDLQGNELVQLVVVAPVDGAIRA